MQNVYKELLQRINRKTPQLKTGQRKLGHCPEEDIKR